MNIPTVNFTTQMICPIRNFFSDQLSLKAEKKKSKLLGDEEIHSFIKNQQQENTVNKTRYDLNVFLNECGERRQLTEIPPAELKSLLCNFYITAKKKDDTEYEPDTMSSFARSIQRSNNLFPDSQKKPNHQKVLSSWLFDTDENQMIRFGF